MDAIASADSADVIGILDPREVLWGTMVDGIPVLGDDALLAELARDTVTHGFVGMGATDAGGNRRRGALAEQLQAAGLLPLTVVHRTAIVSPRATIDAGSTVLAAAVINNGARIGGGAIVNTCAVVEHDCVVGTNAHVAPGARLGGGVTVADYAFVGIGATVVPGVRVGKGAVIGAGAVVLHDVAADAVVAGVPARPLRT